MTTLERFQGAALSLARSGSIKNRLTDAYRNHLALVAVDELPSEVREEFRALSLALTRERPLLRGEDAFRATVRKMSNGEADEVASRVVRIFAALSRVWDGARGKGSRAVQSMAPAQPAEAQGMAGLRVTPA